MPLTMTFQKRRTPDLGTTGGEGRLSREELRKMDAYWRAANYLSVGQIYLLDNPLLKEPLKREHIKPRLLGHWGTTPGLNMLYVHLNRVIKRDDLNMRDTAVRPLLPTPTSKAPTANFIRISARTPKE